ncbi:MAG TPA: LamG domain-containing protein, partial [Fibrobacter sp.]|nr:LamG domain-containing protein [Fibrobacter sp.]
SLWVYWYGKNGNHQILFSQRSFWSDSTSRFQWHFDYINDVFAVYNNIDQRNKFTAVDLPVDEWAYLTLLFKDGLLSMFVNGVRYGEPASFVPTTLNNPVPLRVGGNEVDVESWNGILDEIRVERVARSDAWIRFNYEMQKAARN